MSATISAEAVGRSQEVSGDTMLAYAIQELQESLVEGWHRVKNSPDFNVYSEAFQFFKKAGLYEGLFRPQIPNPVYDNAAKDVGREFLGKSLSLGIAYKELFPGDFTQSTEATVGDREYRYFFLSAHKDGHPIGKLKLTFEHRHEYFDFTRAPLLEIIE